jgi:hypothetical protein
MAGSVEFREIRGIFALANFWAFYRCDMGCACASAADTEVRELRACGKLEADL